jgi:alpha-D-xyloside xylohydrolase
VPSGGRFLDDPDVVSAFTPLPTPGGGATILNSETECSTVSLGNTAGSTITSGNLMAAVGSDGKLTFTRVSDSVVLLAEKNVRSLTPTTTVPPLPGFFSLALSFEAAEGERIYGLGQHAAFAWDHNFPQNGQLDQKGVPSMLLEPHDGDVTIPVVHSSLGYAFLSNLPSTGSVEYNTSGSYWSHSAVLQMDIWVATTSDSPPHAVSPWQQLQQAYADATGHAPVWPEWSTGFWQCKLRYSNQSQIMDVANEYAAPPQSFVNPFCKQLLTLIHYVL